MTRKRRTKLTPLPEIRELSKQVYEELQRALYGTPEDRDKLFAACAEQFSYLDLILYTLVWQDPQEREQTIHVQTARVYAQKKPEAGTAQPGFLAVELSQAILPYLKGTMKDRERLGKNCNHLLLRIYLRIRTLMTRDREERETLVYLNTELAPMLQQATSQALSDMSGKTDR
jgi:hypothetical protein